MEQTLKAPEATQYSTRLESANVMDVDVDVDEVTRKRARIEARRKFRIVTRTIVACGRFRFVLEVDAEKPEQAESEIVASLGNLGLQQLSEESVDARITRHQGLCPTYPGAEGEVIPLPNATYYGSLFIPNGTTAQEESQQSEQPDGEMVTVPYRTDYETFSIQNHAYCPVERQNSGQYQQNEGEMVSLPNATSGSLEVPNQEHCTNEQNETASYEQEVWKFLNKPELSSEDFGTSALEEGDVKVTSRRLWSDWEPLENLRKMDGNSQHWATLASELNDEITRNIQDLESGSGRAKVQKLYKDAEEITKRIGTVGSASEGKKSQKMKPKATSNTWPPIRDVGQYVGEIFEKLKLLVNELNSMYGLQKQVGSLTAMARLIEDGRKALSTLGRGTDWISEKLTTLQKDLKFRELTVDRHFQKCAEVMPAVVESFLKERKGNFISVASLIDWYFEDMSFRTAVKESSAPSSDFNKFLSVF